MILASRLFSLSRFSSSVRVMSAFPSPSYWLRESEAVASGAMEAVHSTFERTLRVYSPLSGSRSRRAPSSSTARRGTRPIWTTSTGTLKPSQVKRTVAVLCSPLLSRAVTGTFTSLEYSSRFKDSSISTPSHSLPCRMVALQLLFEVITMVSLTAEPSKLSPLRLRLLVLLSKSSRGSLSKGGAQQAFSAVSIRAVNNVSLVSGLIY